MKNLSAMISCNFITLWLATTQVEAFVVPSRVARISTPTNLVASLAKKQHVALSTKTSSLYSTSTVEPTTTPLSFDDVPQNKIQFQGIPYQELTIGVLKETYHGENRVSQTPDTVKNLVKEGFSVVVQSGGTFEATEFKSRNEQKTFSLLTLFLLPWVFTLACYILLHPAGAKASFSDAAYAAAGATVVPDADQVFAVADILTKIRPPSDDEIPKLAGKTLIGMVQPAINPELYNQLTVQNTNVFALDCVPRLLSRGQSFDVLSSQANIAGYRAVIEAAESFPRFFAGQMTAAGKVPPAKVLVLGAGVAGLAAIQTAKNMGAIVRAFDVRAVTKEQVESLGATFLEVDVQEDGSGSGGYAKEMSDQFKRAQAALMMEQAKDVDIIITTALIPGKQAPLLVNEEMLAVMKPGSVCVDLAAANGGNVAQTVPDQVITTSNGVTIIGYTDLPSRLASTASNLVRYDVSTNRVSTFETRDD